MNMKAKWLSAIAAPALIFAFGISAAQPGATASESGINSPYRAGYEAVVNNRTVLSFQYVQATFTVPSLNCTQTPTASVAQIVSLDFNNTAEVQESCQNGSPAYEADWSSGCNGHADTLPLTISPGDDVELTVHGSYSTAFDLTTGTNASSDLSTS
jgi:hypothetical protein